MEKTYTFKLILDNSYEVQQSVESISTHLAINQCRSIIKLQYNPTYIWFIDCKIK